MTDERGGPNQVEHVRLNAPFPWFGGKSRAAELIWNALGDCQNYVEPFAGSLAVLLARPHAARTETVNDLDCMIANVWRAIREAPEEVARWADWPVNEADLHARHQWLVDQLAFRERMKTDPDFFDAKIAGWWCWGICQWIGSGWCDGAMERKRPGLAAGGKGVHRQRPRLAAGGMGVHRQLPHISDSGIGVHRATPLYDWMAALSERLRRVRVCCGDWRRVLGPSPTVHVGLTGVLLDPPYSAEAGRDNNLYREESRDVAHDVREWAIEHGGNPMLRIALCGYEGEHAMPAGWRVVEWRPPGGYGTQRRDGSNENQARERLWFSPACLRARGQGDLFAVAAT